MEDSVSWLPCCNDHFSIWKHRLIPKWCKIPKQHFPKIHPILGSTLCLSLPAQGSIYSGISNATRCLPSYLSFLSCNICNSYIGIVMIIWRPLCYNLGSMIFTDKVIVCKYTKTSIVHIWETCSAIYSFNQKKSQYRLEKVDSSFPSSSLTYSSLTYSSLASICWLEKEMHCDQI